MRLPWRATSLRESVGVTGEALEANASAGTACVMPYRFDCGFGGYSTRNRSQSAGGSGGGRACWLAAGDLVVGEGELAA